MTTKIYRWGAATVAQVVTVTITGYDASTTYRLTMNSKIVGVAGTTDVNGTAAALQALLAASNAPPEFQEVTWTVANAVITGTAKTAGKPFTATSSVSGGAGTIGAVTTTTANSGPADLSVVYNWSGAALPSSGDDIYFQESDQDILWNLDALSAVSPLSVNFESTYTGKIGLPEINTDDPSLPYGEYRAKYLVFSPAAGAATATYNVGRGTTQIDGLARLKLDTGQTANASFTVLNIYSTGTPAEQALGLEAVLWKGTVTGTGTNTINITQGTLGIAVLPGESATVNTLRIGYESSRESDVQVRCGTGASFPASSVITKSGGDLVINSATVALTNNGGNCELAAGTHTLVNLDQGTLYYTSTGTLTTINIGTGADLILTRDLRSRTITTCNLYPDGGITDTFRTATWTNGVTLYRCTIGEVRLDLGTHITLTVAAGP